MKIDNPIIIGIVNCTPDSFSDGLNTKMTTSSFSPGSSSDVFIERAQSLIDDGADMLDVGGDSTRPGSVCVNDEEEWSRIEPVLRKFSHRIPISVDTHKTEIARRAIEMGAVMINDITGATDPSLIDIIANSKALLAFMFNSFSSAHSFSNPKTELTKDLAIKVIADWANSHSQSLASQGIPFERQVMDTGLGAFLSPNPDVSFRIIEEYWRIRCPSKGRMLGCSRKGFLKQSGEKAPHDRDRVSSDIAIQVAKGTPADTILYLRVHNVALHRKLIRDSG
jgi:dihydropteroate synthase